MIELYLNKMKDELKQVTNLFRNVYLELNERN